MLRKLADGKSNKLIAHDLGMAEATVKIHVREIMRKLKATNRTQAAHLARAVTERRSGVDREAA